MKEAFALAPQTEDIRVLLGELLAASQVTLELVPGEAV
jgi:hypothetical protein